MDLERTANIAFMILLLVPVTLILAFLNIIVIREMNLAKRRGKEDNPSWQQPEKRGKVSKLHSGKRRPQDRKKALFR